MALVGVADTGLVEVGLAIDVHDGACGQFVPQGLLGGNESLEATGRMLLGLGLGHGISSVSVDETFVNVPTGTAIGLVCKYITSSKIMQ